MSDNKSGFEIRADLLSQAQGIIELNIEREINAVHAHNENNPNDKQPLPVTKVTAADIIATARELNAFVIER